MNKYYLIVGVQLWTGISNEHFLWISLVMHNMEGPIALESTPWAFGGPHARCANKL